MALYSPSGNKKAKIEALITSYPTWAHPDVHYYEDDWRMIRNAYEGERAVKERGIELLPAMAGMDSEQYTLYNENATYFNMVARTVGALSGTIFRRNPVIDDLPKTFKEKINVITKKGQSLRSFTQEVAREVLQMGRVGVLIDASDGGDPYLCMYVAESIIDWESEVVNGREQLTKVVLMEMEEIETTSEINTRTYQVVFRVLMLSNGTYRQEVYRTLAEGATYPNIDGDPDEVKVPTKRGVKFKRIPFKIIGPTAGPWDMQRSPMLDIAAMNISHYRSYAQLEHGRYYTGFPIFWASKASADQTNTYELGPDRVWELPSGEKAGLMEFNGHGLKFLESAIQTKQGHIASLGGRMIGVEVQATAESDNQVNMKDRNEQALLFEVTLSLDEAFTDILRLWAEWDSMNKTAAMKISIEFNKDFMLKEVAAREFRAIQSMYADGILPIEVLFDYMKKAEVIPDWLEIAEFKKLLKSTASFPNNPDVDAKAKGFPDAKSQQQVEEAEKSREHETDEAKLDREAEEEKAKEAAKEAEKTAVIAAANAEKMQLTKSPNDPNSNDSGVNLQGKLVRDQQDKNRT